MSNYWILWIISMIFGNLLFIGLGRFILQTCWNYFFLFVLKFILDFGML